MPFSIEWIVPERVILCRIIGDISTDEMQRVAELMGEHIATGTAPVHSIFDVSQMGKFPASASQINAMSRWVYHASTGWIITINPGRVMAFLTTVVTNMARVKHSNAKSVEEGLQILYRMDVSLPAIQNP